VRLEAVAVVVDLVSTRFARGLPVLRHVLTPVCYPNCVSGDHHREYFRVEVKPSH